MNTDNMTPQIIRQMKMDKLEEIRISQKRIMHHVHETIHPSDTDTNHTDFLWDLFQSGTAILNGITEGAKVIRKVRNFFRNIS